MCSVNQNLSSPANSFSGVASPSSERCTRGRGLCQGAAMQILNKHIKRFLSRISPTDSQGCKNWIPSKPNAYGVMRIGLKNIHTHRLAWIIENGEIPDGLCVLHKCDNPRCVEISHLFLGTKGDNNRDRASKGRSHTPGGELHISKKHPGCMAHGELAGSAKLSETDILEIKKLLNSGVMGFVIAKQFGVAKSHISHIKNNKVWKHLTNHESTT